MYLNNSFWTLILGQSNTWLHDAGNTGILPNGLGRWLYHEEAGVRVMVVFTHDCDGLCPKCCSHNKRKASLRLANSFRQLLQNIQHSGLISLQHTTAAFLSSVETCYLKGTSMVYLTPYASAREAMSIPSHIQQNDRHRLLDHRSISGIYGATKCICDNKA